MADPETEAAPTLATLRTQAQEEGFHEPLGDLHEALHITRGDLLIVSFEGGETFWSPEVAESLDASLLMVHSTGASWYRTSEVHDFFDALVDDGFFDDFDEVVFVGSGMGAYGASVFSVSHPGSHVVLVGPVATLEPSRVPWDKRWPEARRLSWGPRYSYGPDMIQGAGHVTIITDPTINADAAQASLFHGDHILHVQAPHGGNALISHLASMRLLSQVIMATVDGAMTPHLWARMWRKRRKHVAYLKALLAKLLVQDRLYLVAMLCEHVNNTKPNAAFAQRLERTNARLRAEGIVPPGERDPVTQD